MCKNVKGQLPPGTDTLTGPMVEPTDSTFRVEKERAHAILTLSSGQSAEGCFFLASPSSHGVGRERVGELLNSATGFFPFEIHGTRSVRTALLNRSQLVTVALSDPEAGSVPGYEVATRRRVRIDLVGGRRIEGVVRVYRPAGRDRLSDWAADPEPFRYVETDELTLLVNMAHVIEISEASR